MQIFRRTELPFNFHPYKNFHFYPCKKTPLPAIFHGTITRFTKNETQPRVGQQMPYSIKNVYAILNFLYFFILIFINLLISTFTILHRYFNHVKNEAKEKQYVCLRAEDCWQGT